MKAKPIRALKYFPKKLTGPGKKPGQQQLKEEIMRFAGKTHSRITEEKNHEFLRRTSQFVETASFKELKKYRQKIRTGRLEKEYSIPSILSKDGEQAEEICLFLTPTYFDRFVKILSGPNNLAERGLAKKALLWEYTYGNLKSKAHALTGITLDAARETEPCTFGLCSRPYSGGGDSMKFVSREIGINTAWKLTDKINKMRDRAYQLTIGISFLCGAGAGTTSTLFFREETTTLFEMGLLGGVVALLGKNIVDLLGASKPGISMSILKQLKKKSGEGHV